MIFPFVNFFCLFFGLLRLFGQLGLPKHLFFFKKKSILVMVDVWDA